MKKFVVLAILAVASLANAGIIITGVPTTPLLPSDTITLSLVGDGQTDRGIFGLGISSAVGNGPGHIDLSSAVMLYQGVQSVAPMYFDDAEIAGAWGVHNPFVYMEMVDIRTSGTLLPLTGLLVDGIKFHCNGMGDVTIMLLDGDGNVIDSQIIKQIPEPMTVALLGLGGLFLRRRIA